MLGGDGHRGCKKDDRKRLENGYIYDVTRLRFGYVVYGDPVLDWTKRYTTFDAGNRYLVLS